MGGISQLRALGVFHKIGYARVALRGLYRPLPPRGRFPAAASAVRKPAGLVALGGTLSPETLMEAYRAGIYPMYFQGPVKWWAPDPRVVLFLENMRIEKRGLRKLLQSGRYRVSFDTCFDEVIRQCGNRETTWISDEVAAAYRALHQQGHAHSVEVWDEADQLVGGLYGVASGRIFSTESAFQQARDAIRVAMAHLNCHLQHWGFLMNDMQVGSPLANSLGCEEIPRSRYCELLAGPSAEGLRVGPWSVSLDLDVAGWSPSGSESPCGLVEKTA